MSASISEFLDCKTVRIFAYSSTREQSNKRSGMRLKTESETGESPHTRVRLARVRLLRHALPISLLILREKPTVLQSSEFQKTCLRKFSALVMFLDISSTILWRCKLKSPQNGNLKKRIIHLSRKII